MSKGLEALERIKNAPTIYVGCASDVYTRYPFECKIIEKELKALEIIKKKVMSLVSLEDETAWNDVSYRGYRVYDNELYQYTELTKEEYDLLKEVLE